MRIKGISTTPSTYVCLCFPSFLPSLMFCCFVYLFDFWNRFPLCRPSCPGTHFIDYAGLRRSSCLCLSSVDIKGMSHAHCYGWISKSVFRFFKFRVYLSAPSHLEKSFCPDGMFNIKGKSVSLGLTPCGVDWPCQSVAGMAQTSGLIRTHSALPMAEIESLVGPVVASSHLRCSFSPDLILTSLVSVSEEL